MSATNRSYQPGDIIMPECEPLIKVLLGAHKDSYCRNCFRNAHSLKFCSRCKIVKYCSMACQKKDWRNGHKLECSSTFFRTHCKANAVVSVDIVEAVYRMHALFTMQPTLRTKQFALHDSTTRCFDDLMSHREILSKTRVVDDWRRRLDEIKVDEPETESTVEDLVRLHGVFQTNSFYIPDTTSTQIGTGLYIQASVFDHSCRPNAHVERIGIRAHVRAVAPIPVNEKPYISYITSCMDTTRRRKLLRERYNFVCHCQRCDGTADAGIDYAMLNSRMEERDRLYGMVTSCSEAEPGFGWDDVYAEHEEMLKVLRQMYNEYDEPITDHFRETVGIGMNPKFLGPKKNWEELVSETLKRINVTFGKENKQKALFDGDIGLKMIR